jgi:hypothetical protein
VPLARLQPQHFEAQGKLSSSFGELRARTNRLTDLIPLVPSLLSAIETATPGMLQLVGEP